MNSFTLSLCSAARTEKLEDLLAFVAEDDSGSFSIWARHERFCTVLNTGLSRLRMADGRQRYLAMPGAVLSFRAGELTLSTRKYWIEDDFERVSELLKENLLAEEQALGTVRQSLHQLEEELLRRLYQLDR